MLIATPHPSLKRHSNVIQKRLLVIIENGWYGKIEVSLWIISVSSVNLFSFIHGWCQAWSFSIFKHRFRTNLFEPDLGGSSSKSITKGDIVVKIIFPGYYCNRILVPDRVLPSAFHNMCWLIYQKKRSQHFDWR